MTARNRRLMLAFAPLGLRHVLFVMVHGSGGAQTGIAVTARTLGSPLETRLVAIEETAGDNARTRPALDGREMMVRRRLPLRLVHALPPVVAYACTLMAFYAVCDMSRASYAPDFWTLVVPAARHKHLLFSWALMGSIAALFLRSWCATSPVLPAPTPQP